MGGTGSGRNDTWKDEFIEKAGEFAKEGATRKGMAKACGVSRWTFRKWMVEHPDLKEAVEEGEDFWNSQGVEDGLWKIGKGYYYTETKVTNVELTGKQDLFDQKTTNVKVPARKITKTTKYHAPNVTAIIFALINRQPERWKDVQQVEIFKGGTKQLEDRLNKAHERARAKAKKEGKVVEMGKK